MTNKKVTTVSNSNLLKKRNSSEIFNSSNESNEHDSTFEVKRRRLNETDRETTYCQTSVQSIPSCSKDQCNSEINQISSHDLRESLEEELKCSICSEIFIDAVTLNCSHSFCRFCISKWMKEQSTCPICRQEISSQNYTLVLDKCVKKILENSPEKTKIHRTKVLKNRKKQEELENSAGSTSRQSEERSLTSEQLSNNIVGNLNIFELIDYILDHAMEDSIQQAYDPFDQCTIN